MFVLTHAVYFWILYMWKPIGTFLQTRTKVTGKRIYSKIANIFYPVFFWGFPLFNLILFQIRWKAPALVIFIALVWYLSLVIYKTSNRLHREKINIFRLEGKFAALRGRFYRFVRLIPIIGKKKSPFRALNQVSLEIGKGMFGLLGPNGAGKTTLMRIVCGILEQSYGKIWIKVRNTGTCCFLIPVLS